MNNIYGENIKYKVTLYENKYNRLLMSFDCGNKEINKYLNKANEQFKNGMGVTKLILNEKETEIIGFYTLCSSAMLQTVDKHNRALPAIEIKMFAINLKYQNIPFYKESDEIFTFSDAIFSDIIADITELSDEMIGIKFITLYSVENAINFYKRNLFLKVKDFNEYLALPYDRYSEGCEQMCFILS